MKGRATSALRLQAGTFYGATSKTVSVSGFRFTEKAYGRERALPRHSHELAHFCFVLAGSYTETVAGKMEERSPRSLIFYPPDTAHAEEHHTTGRHFLIELEPWRAGSILDYGSLRLDAVAPELASRSWLAAKLYREFAEMDGLSALALEGMALELVVGTLRSRVRRLEGRSPVWLNRAREILEASFSNPPSLEELARAVGVHPVHLAREFRRFEHCTTGEFIRKLRVDYARERIFRTDEPLVEIALSSGFADHAHFSRSFKRVTGMTPTDFRKLVRGR